MAKRALLGLKIMDDWSTRYSAPCIAPKTSVRIYETPNAMYHALGGPFSAIRETASVMSP